MPNRREKYADMVRFRQTRNEQRKRYYEKTAIYKKRRWTVEEDEAVLAQDITDSELSLLIERSVEAIQIRRSRLKSNGK